MEYLQFQNAIAGEQEIDNLYHDKLKALTIKDEP